VLSEFLTIGVLGGMGPEATNRLCARITQLTPATRDQEHIPVICYNNPRIPSRLDAAAHEGQTPLPELIRTARVLEAAGANFIVLPCNSAHIYLAELQASVGIPIINIIDEVVRFIRRQLPEIREVGVMASTPTINNRLYHEALADHYIEIQVPNEEQQEQVIEAIHGKNGVKAGFIIEPARMLTSIGEHITANGAEAIVVGCTEISVAFAQHPPAFKYIDSLDVLARVAVEKATKGIYTDGKYSLHSSRRRRRVHSRLSGVEVQRR
jgi:aspartate racemase